MAIINRVEELSHVGNLKYEQVCDILKKEGFKTRKNSLINRNNLYAIFLQYNRPFPKFAPHNEVLISRELLKKAIIDSIKQTIAISAKQNGINRETLRLRFKKEFPFLYRNKNKLRVFKLFLLEERFGTYVHGPWIFDAKWEKFVKRFGVVDNGNGYGRCSFDYYHRVISGAKKGDIVDHINRNKYDNRLENLRICNHSQNSKNKTSKGFFEVIDRKLSKRFVARINGKRKYFATAKEAQEAYQNDHIERNGEFSPYFKDETN